MLNAEIEQVGPAFPRGFRRDFDAHIYYHPENRGEAVLLREKVLLELGSLPIFVSALIDKKVGPHPTFMFEICFSTELVEEIRDWLNRNRAHLTVLLHTVPGNDPKDHSAGAEWLGDPVKLDFSQLDPEPAVVGAAGAGAGVAGAGSSVGRSSPSLSSS
jgi:aromatic ring-cleaving dioxygenase